MKDWQAGMGLDQAGPLHRSEEKLKIAAFRLLRLCKSSPCPLFSLLQIEQEFLVIDRGGFSQRPDLVLTGRTLLGAPLKKEVSKTPPLKTSVLSYLEDARKASSRLGIEVKIELAEGTLSPHHAIFLPEKTSLAIDHYLRWKQLLQDLASQQELACLFHEKPFAGIKGSEKWIHWSLVSDTGVSLLEPGSLSSLILLTALFRGVHEQAELLRVALGAVSGDSLIGNFSIYLGEKLGQLIEGAENLQLEGGDSNFAFRKNRLAFRLADDSVHPAFAVAVIQASAADHLTLLLDEIADLVGDQKLEAPALFTAIRPILKKHLTREGLKNSFDDKEAVQIFCSGGKGIVGEQSGSEGEKLPAKPMRSTTAFSELLDRKTKRVFEDVLNEEELQSYYEFFVAEYGKEMHSEATLLVELFRAKILPALIERQGESLQPLIEAAIQEVDGLEKGAQQTEGLGWEAKTKVFYELIEPKKEQVRKLVDLLETQVESACWPYPQYDRLLGLQH